MDILLSIIGSAVLAVLLATAYTAGVAAGKAAAHVDDEESKIQLSGLEHSPEDNMIFQQNINIVMECIPRLKKKYRDLIYARLDGKSYQQISKELAIPEATVKTCLNKARQRLKQLFNQY